MMHQCCVLPRLHWGIENPEKESYPLNSPFVCAAFKTRQYCQAVPRGPATNVQQLSPGFVMDCFHLCQCAGFPSEHFHAVGSDRNHQRVPQIADQPEGATGNTANARSK
eukprot:2505436-Karenia_brevis.AAC.1